ncbi:MAG: cytochrome c [Myxococcota bacterium]
MRRFIFAGFLLLGCSTPEPKAPLPSRVLGGVEVDGATLARGERGYRTVCASCHGLAGDGNGRLGVRQEPKPRSFAEGIVKFSSVRAGELWRDEDVMWTLKNGLLGTQMLAVKLRDDDLMAIVQYIKTFSPRWQTEKPGEVVPVPATPAPPPSAVDGASLYAGRCASCHDHRKSVSTVWGAPSVSPDLRKEAPKAGSEPARLYRRLAAGIGGIEDHGPLAGVLTEEQLWALVYYVRGLSSR